MTTTKLTGHDAIEALRDGRVQSLSKYADPTEDAREGLTLEEAEDVAAEDPSLLWAEAEIGPERRVKNAGGLDELAAMMEDGDLREWMFGDPEDRDANAYRWDDFVPTFGGEHAGDAVDGWYVLSWDEDRVLWLHPEEGAKMEPRA